MEIENVKLNWKPLIEFQKKEYLKKYPFSEIDRIFDSLEKMLDQNSIPSRVVVGNGRVKAFAYLLDNHLFRNRINGYICFPEPELYSKETLGNIIQWMKSYSERKRSQLMIQDISGVDVEEGPLKLEGFLALERFNMRIDLSTYEPAPDVEPRDIEISDFSSFDLQEYLEAQKQSYEDSSEAVFLMPESEDGRKALLNTVLEGAFGEILYDASFLLKVRGKIAGGLLACSGLLRTDGRRIPLIEDLFVLKPYRNTGAGKALLSRSLKSLRNANHQLAELTVSSGNNALQLYEKTGFRKYGSPERMYLLGFKE